MHNLAFSGDFPIRQYTNSSEVELQNKCMPRCFMIDTCRLTDTNSPLHYTSVVVGGTLIDPIIMVTYK
jgi:hypothetical protein